LNFSVEYDRAKCQERVGENGIKNQLTVWILRVKWLMTKNRISRLSVTHDRAPYWNGPCVWLDSEPHDRA